MAEDWILGQPVLTNDTTFEWVLGVPYIVILNEAGTAWEKSLSDGVALVDSEIKSLGYPKTMVKYIFDTIVLNDSLSPLTRGYILYIKHQPCGAWIDYD